MQQLKLFKRLLPLVLTFFFTACGGGGGSTPDAKTQAISKIEAYANDNSQAAPTLQDYSDAGVQGVTADNLDDLNDVVAGLTAEDVDTTEEITALTASLGINIIPVANAQSITVNEDTSNNAITLTASDADADTLTYTLVTQPSHGTLSGTAPSLSYTPTADYFGSDSFTFKVNDGTVDSATVTVNITVSDVAEPNTAPVANAQTVTVNEDTSNNAITLTASDADADTLTYTLVTQPSHGTLSGTAPSLSYTPTADYFGADSFTFKVNDGTVDSATVTVGITVNDVPEPDTTPPVVTLNGDANVSIYLNQTYTELNATATDAVDGNVSASIVITGTVDNSVLGENNISYTATDSAGNEANVTRTVNVLSTLKKTGQTISYDTDGNEVLDGSVKDDGYYEKGTTPSYTRDDGNETVTDNLTGLMWQDDAAVASVTKQWLTDENYATCENNTSDPACFDTSGDTATTYCTELVMGGYEDWRLPTSVELEGIVDYGLSDPAIDTTFQNTSSSDYWSSTSVVGVEDYAWIVYFYDGDVYGVRKGNSNYIRCVRDGQ